jgi:hypothetical protein
VVWLDLFHSDALFGGFVLNVVEQASKCPDMVPLCLWKSLSNIAQVLEREYVAVVFDGFRDEFIGDRMDVLFAPGFFTLPEAK